MRRLQPGLDLTGLAEWECAGQRLRVAAKLHTAKGSSRSSIVNCMDARTVINDDARKQLRGQAQRYCADPNFLGKWWNRMTFPGGGARLSKHLFPEDYRKYRDDLLFVAHHQFATDTDPCMVLLITHTDCGLLNARHPNLSFEGALTATYEAGVEIAQELDDLERGAIVIVVADGLVGNESEGIERYRFCGIIPSSTRTSLPADPTTLAEEARKELTTHLG